MAWRVLKLFPNLKDSVILDSELFSQVASPLPDTSKPLLVSSNYSWLAWPKAVLIKFVFLFSLLTAPECEVLV